MLKKNSSKPLKLKTQEIEVAIAKFFDYRRNLIVPNISFGLTGMHECDVFIVRESGYVVEVEIKISKADLLKDFDKKHQHRDRQNRICEFYYAMPLELYEKTSELIPADAGIIVCEKKVGWKGREEVYTKFKRRAKRIKKARKLTPDEIHKVARLGCMRIFTLKEKLIKISSN